jgi:putative hydrolase of the HAD superfamily
MIEWIAFDADDTLWKNEENYLKGREKFLDILTKYGVKERDLDQIEYLEVENIQYYGYGVMSFVLSLIEMAIEITGEKIHPVDIRRILDLGKEMLSVEIDVFDGVLEVLDYLIPKYHLMLITKGDLFHQQRKLDTSGLQDYFQTFEVVSNKTSEAYGEILERHQINPTNFLMIGNSLRSDVIPVLNLGGWAIHLTGHLTWSHEDDPLEGIPQERYLEAKRITDILAALDELKI